jgi:HD superfamily phosphodiesterase
MYTPNRRRLLACSCLMVLAGAVGAPAGAAATAAPPAPAPLPAPAADWRATVRHFAQDHFRNPAWGYSHSLRDYALARALAASDRVTVDDDVLFAAAFLHDMAAFPPWGGGAEPPDHSDLGADAVGKILEGTGFPMGKLDAVRAAIRTHMYYRDPVGPESVYLHDADALDWLGAIGVARIIALVDPNGGDPDGPKAVAMIRDNLREVPSRIVSPAGRARIAQRSAELERFLRELGAESAGFGDL